MSHQLFHINYYLIIISLGLLYLAPDVCQASHSSLHVVDGGYKGVVIAISPEIPEDKDLLDKIQSMVTEASNVLSESIGLYFSEVTIKVPNSWSNAVTDKQIQEIPIQDSDADVVVINRDAEQSFTMQFAGCGLHALPIVLTKKTVKDSVDYGSVAKLLVHEWSHYRYGVFNEFGYNSDPIYPAYYSIAGNPNASEILINSCADKEFSFKSQTQTTGGQCTLAINNATGLPVNGHCVPVPAQDSSFESSLMYAHSPSGVKRFCGDTRFGQELHKHNTKSPNKQNYLCDGRDTWAVIASHPDHTNSKNSIYREANSGITFNIVKQPDQLLTLFAIQNAPSMHTTSSNQYNLLKLAMIKYGADLPDSMVARTIINNDNKFDQDVNWIQASRLTMLKLVENKALPSVNLETIINHGLTFFDAKSTGGVFVIVIAGDKIETPVSKVVELATKLRNKNIKLNLIVFPFDSKDNRITASEALKTAAHITNGRVTYVKGDKTSWTASHFLKAFTSLTNNFQTIAEKYIDDQTKDIDFEFAVDDSLHAANLRVYFMRLDTSVNTDPLSDTIKLVTPGSVTKLNYQDTMGYIQGFSVQIDRSDQIGKWHLTATRKADPPGSWEPLLAIAEFETKSGRQDDNPITGQCWLNTVEYNPKEVGNKPVMAYVNVHRKVDELISGVSVKLIIVSEFDNQPKTVELVDDGLGDPDITKGDGIYSTYVTDIGSQGYFTISAEITSDTDSIEVTKEFGSTSLPIKSTAKTCCGSRVDGTRESVSSQTKLVRRVECGTLYVTDTFVASEYPPSAVRDLRIESAEYDNRTVNLLWTSPGGDYTAGFVNKYDIKAFVQKDNYKDDQKLLEDIRSNFEKTDGADIDVSVDTLADGYGKPQRSQIRINSNAGGVYYLAFRAFDADKHPSVVSNIVMAYIKSNVIIQSTTAYASDVSIAEVGNGSDEWLLAGMTWWEIMLIAIGVAVVLIVVGVFLICCICKRRRKNDDVDRETSPKEAPVPALRRAPDPPRVSPELEKNRSILLDDNTSLTRSVETIPNIHINNLQHNNAYNTNPNHNMNNMYNTGSQHNSYNSGSQQNLRELNVNALGPMAPVGPVSGTPNAWDAKDLLNHWGRVQEAKQRHERPPVFRNEDLESGSSNHSPSYASSDEDNNIYTNPNIWQYNDMNARPTYAIPNSYNDPIYRTALDHPGLRSNTPSDNVPRYSTILRKPTQNVSQV